MYVVDSPTITINHDSGILVFGEGLYFGLPDEIYHRIPALSSTGLKNLLVSAPDFYFNSELNPNRALDNEDDESKEWRRFGKASHMRILEGKEVFYNRYCVEFLAPEGCLDTTAELVAYLTEAGVIAEKNPDPDAVTKSSKKPALVDAVNKHDATAIERLGLKTAEQLIEYLVNAEVIKEKVVDPDAVTKSSPKANLIRAALKHNPNVLIYDVERDKYFKETGGKTQLTENELRRIEIAAAMIEYHPELRHYFHDGYPEVTIVFQMDNLWFKARFDYLKVAEIVDLKTFTNRLNKKIDKALHEAMAAQKYHIQVAFYRAAASFVVDFARKGNVNVFHQSAKPSDDFIARLGQSTGHDFINVFQKKGGAPLARGKRFSHHLNMYEIAIMSIKEAIGLFRENYAKFGNEIWVDFTPVTDFEDESFPVYATEL